MSLLLPMTVEIAELDDDDAEGGQVSTELVEDAEAEAAAADEEEQEWEWSECTKLRWFRSNRFIIWT